VLCNKFFFMTWLLSVHPSSDPWLNGVGKHHITGDHTAQQAPALPGPSSNTSNLHVRMSSSESTEQFGLNCVSLRHVGADQLRDIMIPRKDENYGTQRLNYCTLPKA
jgi:hypothetical protein